VVVAAVLIIAVTACMLTPRRQTVHQTPVHQNGMRGMKTAMKTVMKTATFQHEADQVGKSRQC